MWKLMKMKNQMDKLKFDMTALLILVSLMFVALSLAACSPTPEIQVTDVPEAVGQLPSQNEQVTEGTSASDAITPSTNVAPTEKVPESEEVIEAKWQTSPHAASYVLDESGQNATCAKCHAPVNWVPSMDEMPESCYSCKFEVNPPDPLITESDWTNIECKVCHEVKRKKVQSEISWLEIAQIGEYSTVETVDALCLKCHIQTEELANHADFSMGGAHAEMACNDCHDAHDQTANCNQSGCHATIDAGDKLIPGHDADHESVSCSACHDASGLEVGPDANGFWVTFHPQPADSGAEKVGFVSHNTVLEASCERCHFESNPWELNLVETDSP